MTYSYLDIFLTIAAVILAIRGFTRGFVKEFFSLGALILGVLAAIFFYTNGAAFIRSNFLDTWGVPEVLAFVIIFLMVFILCRAVQKVLSDIIKGMHLMGLDKILGCILGLVEGIIAICVILFVIYIQPLFESSEILAGSMFGKALLPLIIDNSGIIEEILPAGSAILPGLFFRG